MDALPIEERADVAFKSNVKAEYLGDTVSVMHACGHDTHVAMLMGTAEVLASMRNELPGTVKFIFQPAEEGPPGDEEGGAALMVKNGVMDNPKVDAAFGLHINSGLDIARSPFGAFGGRADVMSVFDSHKPGALTHSGTFNNNVLSMSAGALAMGEIFDDREAEALRKRGDGLRDALNAVCAKHEIGRAHV